MLNALSVALQGANREGVARAEKSFRRQGFVLAAQIDWHGGLVNAWACPSQPDSDHCLIQTPSEDACCVGPLWYRGQFGHFALRSIVEEFITTGHVDETMLRGNFALFMRTASDCLLMNDALGLARIHVSADGLFYSTSWLACCAYADRLELDEPAAIEYVLLGASHSDQTVARGVTTLPLAHDFDLTRRQTRPRQDLLAALAAHERGPATFEEALHDISAHLRTVCREVVAAFPRRTRMALSGGFDSRLILSGLLASGGHPELFVYGDAACADVRVARAVANRAGLSLNAIDKSELDRQHALPNLEQLVGNALFFDGLPNDGIHDSGADRQTRLQQTAGGFLALNGGGGEIFRNYFHLPDRHLSTMDIVRAFYRGFDHDVFRRTDGLSCYEADLAASIARSIGLDDLPARQKLKREQVEQVYPLFRCHHWMGVNNSVALRHGYYVTPLVDLTTVRLAARLPLAWKNAGKLESRLIAQLHPGVAQQMSEYGFRFSDGPHRHARFSAWMTRMRPVRARPFINATHRRMHRQGVTPGVLQHYRLVLPGEWQLDPLINLDRLPDTQAFARALAVEVAWRELLA